MATNFVDPPSYSISPLTAQGTDYPAGHFYYIWYTDEPVNFALNQVPDHYVLRNWKGEDVATGSGSVASISLGLLPAGHYRLYFYQPGGNDPTFGECAGSYNIAVWRRKTGMPPRPVDQFEYQIETMNTLCAINATTIRFPVVNAAVPTTNIGINEIDHDLPTFLSQYMAYPDLARPDKEWIIHFPYGTEAAGSAAGVQTVINHFGIDHIWYECRNEPDNGTSATNFVPELQRFHDMVKAANPNARVLGPNQVTLAALTNGNGVDWTRELLENGGGAYLDGYSFHAYNSLDGELVRGRKYAEELVRILTKFGQQNKPRWMTEWGTFAATGGSFTPSRQLRWIMLALIFWEQYGVPKEHMYYFYNRSHGFWSFPSFIVSDHNGLFPAATAMRVFSEEVFGKAYAERLNFGDEENDFIGSRYSGSGSDLLVLMACGRPNDSVTFTITGATSLVIGDAVGATMDTAVVDGKLTVNVPASPLYIHVPNGVTAAVVPRVLGRNVIHDGNWTRSASSTGMTAADVLASGSYIDNTPYYDDGPLPVTLSFDLGQATTFDTIIVRGTQPWQVRSAILAATVEAYIDTVWVQVAAINHNYRFLPFVSHWRDSGTLNETFYDERYNWLLEIGHKVRATKIRIIVTSCTSGGEANEVANGDGQGLGRIRLSLQGIELYNAAESKHPAHVIAGP